MNKEQAAIKIQSLARGFLSRKRTNLRGESEGKEIEIYLPFSTRHKVSKIVDPLNMVGEYKTTLYKSDFFNIQIDCMNFPPHHFKIPEIVTAPFRSPYSKSSNLPSEHEIDRAVGHFICLIEDFVKHATKHNSKEAFLSLDLLISQYNKQYPQHPLSMTQSVKKYLSKPMRRSLFSDNLTPVERHHNIELGLLFEPGLLPSFDDEKTPRTEAAAAIITQKLYTSGFFLLHVQKTISLPIEHYSPRFLAREINPAFHNTAQQMNYLVTARQRAEQLIEKHPLPEQAHKERILGLLTVCAEQVLTVVYGREYVGLHEKADRPVLSIRHILHYVKINICNAAELQWFKEVFQNHPQDIHAILGQDTYTPDYRSKNCGYGSSVFDQDKRYDVIFDLFGDFANGKKLDKADIALAVEFKLKEYGMTSWQTIYDNHISLSGRTHLSLQKVGKELHPLFEARRIGLMTPAEFSHGRSQVHIANPTERLNISQSFDRPPG